VLLYLARHFHVEPHKVQVRRAHPDDFILIFSTTPLAARVFLAPPPQEVEFVLRFRCWHKQSRALFSPLWYKVLLAIDNIPAHAWSPSLMQAIISSSCLNFEVTSSSVNRVDLSRFFIMAWAIHPDLILNEVGFMIPKPKEPFQEGVPPLFLRASEIIHSKSNTLQYRAFVHVLEVHDFTLLDDSKTSDSYSSDSGGDGLSGASLSSLRLWPHMFQLCGDSDEDGNQLPSLSRWGLVTILIIQ
jgi:hypothetical protein